MRLISQDGTYDFPYERVVVYRNETSVVCGIMPDIREKVLLGKYNSKTKALKVIEMLRSTYVNNEYYKSLCSGIVIPLPNNSDDMKEKMAATHTFRATTIFQFPKDEEVEV